MEEEEEEEKTRPRGTRREILAQRRSKTKPECGRVKVGGVVVVID